MALKTLVKISSVNNLSDARYGAGMGVAFMGFNLDESDSNAIGQEKFTEITNWISGVKIVGEFGGTSSSKIEETASDLDLDFIQVDDVNQILALENINLPILLKIDITHYNDLQQLKKILKTAKEYIAYFLFESENSNDQEINSILKLSDNFPILLNTGVTIENLNHITTQSNIKGIALKGGNEIQPGLRDFDEMADILEFLEID